MDINDDVTLNSDRKKVDINDDVTDKKKWTLVNMMQHIDRKKHNKSLQIYDKKTFKQIQIE